MITSGFKLRSPPLSLFSAPIHLQRRRLPSPRSIRRMEGAEYIPLGFLGVIHRASGSVTFQEHDCRLARGWLEAVTLLYERYTPALSHPASDTRGFSCRVNGRREPRSSVDARINIAGCQGERFQKSWFPSRNNNTSIVVSRPSCTREIRKLATSFVLEHEDESWNFFREIALKRWLVYGRMIRTEEEGGKAVLMDG